MNSAHVCGRQVAGCMLAQAEQHERSGSNKRYIRLWMVCGTPGVAADPVPPPVAAEVPPAAAAAEFLLAAAAALPAAAAAAPWHDKNKLRVCTARGPELIGAVKASEVDLQRKAGAGSQSTVYIRCFVIPQHLSGDEHRTQALQD